MITVTSRQRNGTKDFVQSQLELSDGIRIIAKPFMKIPVQGDFEAAVSKLNKWEADLVDAINIGSALDA